MRKDEGNAGLSTGDTDDTSHLSDVRHARQSPLPADIQDQSPAESAKPDHSGARPGPLFERLAGGF